MFLLPIHCAQIAAQVQNDEISNDLPSVPEKDKKDPHPPVLEIFLLDIENPDPTIRSAAISALEHFKLERVRILDRVAARLLVEEDQHVLSQLLYLVQNLESPYHPEVLQSLVHVLVTGSDLASSTAVHLLLENGHWSMVLSNLDIILNKFKNEPTFRSDLSHELRPVIKANTTAILNSLDTQTDTSKIFLLYLLGDEGSEQEGFCDRIRPLVIQSSSRQVKAAVVWAMGAGNLECIQMLGEWLREGTTVDVSKDLLFLALVRCVDLADLEHWDSIKASLGDAVMNRITTMLKRLNPRKIVTQWRTENGLAIQLAAPSVTLSKGAEWPLEVLVANAGAEPIVIYKDVGTTSCRYRVYLNDENGNVITCEQPRDFGIIRGQRSFDNYQLLTEGEIARGNLCFTLQNTPLFGLKSITDDNLYLCLPKEQLFWPIIPGQYDIHIRYSGGWPVNVVIENEFGNKEWRGSLISKSMRITIEAVP